MNIIELEDVLTAEGFDPKSYSLSIKNQDPNEALCLRKDGENWVVYYSERGLKTGKQTFLAESEACSYFLESQRSDPTTKLGWKSGFSL